MRLSTTDEAIPMEFKGDSDLLRTLIDHLPDCFIYVKDAQSRFIFTNVPHLKLLGLASVEEVVGRTDFDFFPKELAEQYYADEQKVITSGKPVLDREEETVYPDGNRIRVLTTKVPLLADDGSVVGVMGITRDITRLKQLEDELREQSITDELTGAYNRRWLKRDLPILLNAFARAGQPVSLIMFDIDVLKEINDKYGHALGDEALKTFTRTTRKLLKRSTDVLVRFGGDEFLLVLFNVEPPDAEQFAGELLQEMRQTNIMDATAGEEPVHVTFSAGVFGQKITEIIEPVIKHADTALYAAKDQGRNRVVLYTPELEARP